MSNELIELLSANFIPVLLSEKLTTAIRIIDSNMNEKSVVEPLRQLIISLSNSTNSVEQSIRVYLDTPNTQFSATREIFNELAPRVEQTVEQPRVIEQSRTEREAGLSNGVDRFIAQFKNMDYRSYRRLD